MKIYYFSEMPHHEYPDDIADEYRSLRIIFPNTHFDTTKQPDLFQRYFDEYQYADEMGFAGVMINEHHSTPSCSDVSVHMSAAILARITKRAKILLLGSILPIQENPVMLAEQIAMADQISRGRIISGVVRGIGVESWWANINPVHNRERFEECHDLMLKAWTVPGPWRWEGKHYHFRHVNPWMLPYQKPHPPIWVPGTASPETAIWAGERGYTYVPFLTPLEVARELFTHYRKGAEGAGHPATDENFGFMICAVAADTEEKAAEAGKHFIWRMGRTLKGWTELYSAPGMQSRAANQVYLKAKSEPLSRMSYEELRGRNLIVAGTPDHLIKTFKYLKQELGIGHLIIEGQESRMDHPTTMRSLELIGKEVIPALAEA